MKYRITEATKTRNGLSVKSNTGSEYDVTGIYKKGSFSFTKSEIDNAKAQILDEMQARSDHFTNGEKVQLTISKNVLDYLRSNFS